ncbi:MAG: HipA domain-containing protein [Candidatus Marinimicrobia bacterium]|nr:HipA domain-containing protein [Candidatus Neomarinimicrobiota bacterium]
MNRCPITYEECGQTNYSRKGLNLLSGQLANLEDIPYSAQEQIEQSVARAGRMSIPGAQPKLSARLSVKNNCFEVVDMNGRFILKPQSQIYNNVPENEDLTMKLAKTVGLETPVHGLVYCKDGSFTYFIKRFDRIGHKDKLAVEDFAQLSGSTRDTKYDSSMEKAATLLDYCTFPVVEKMKFFKQTLFAFLIGNEDMHLKNFSLITRNSKVELSPLYDQINTTILLLSSSEEMALPLHGKKRNLTKNDFISYFAKDRLKLTEASIQNVLKIFREQLSHWKQWIDISFLPEKQKKDYWELVEDRASRIGL